jgi:hypothetical protein
MDPRKAVHDLIASREIIVGNAQLFRSGNKHVYRVIAVELRKLLFDGKNSLVPRIFPNAALHPHASYRPGEDVTGLVFQLPGMWTPREDGRAVLLGLFDERRAPIPIHEWGNQPFLSGQVSLQEFVRSVADKEGAHSDKVYNEVLLLARSVRVASDEIYDHLIVGIGDYVARMLVAAFKSLPPHLMQS